MGDRASSAGGGRGSGVSLGGAGFRGSIASVKVLKVVAAVIVVDWFELDSVRPEKLLESDWRGRADFDMWSNRKSSNT